MDRSAELTLHILHCVQRHVHGESRPFPATWSIWPRGQRVTWAEARDVLAALPKPVLVVPLLEPGTFAIWTESQLDDAQRPGFAYQFANQVQYYSEKLAALAVPSSGEIRFAMGPDAPPCIISVPTFLCWASEYALGVGVSLAAADLPGAAVVIVRPPGGGSAPLVV